MNEALYKEYYIERGADLVMLVRDQWIKLPTNIGRGNAWICSVCGKGTPDSFDIDEETGDLGGMTVPLVLFIGSPNPDRQIDLHFECAKREGIMNL